MSLRMCCLSKSIPIVAGDVPNILCWLIVVGDVPNILVYLLLVPMISSLSQEHPADVALKEI